MHELAVTESILSISEKYAKENGALKVTSINLVIGRLSSIVDESVQFYWDIISKDSLCYQAILNFERRSAVLHCNVCDHEYEIDTSLQPCPACGSPNIKVISGEEFFVDSIEIEKADER
ncbi:MAG: hydrogenase maturation nickel metallochaperone HypA [Chloroflexi bacterium]|nr:hydrogenase maturation nickel metallochaperone HypA [Chloroflexota bacterium]